VDVRDFRSRRSVLKLASLVLPFGRMGVRSSLADKDGSANRVLVTDLFPTQPPELTREIVTVAHFDLKRVRELVEARPSLARAAWDLAIGSQRWAPLLTWGTRRLPST
jgi:hypothetical protein